MPTLSHGAQRPHSHLVTSAIHPTEHQLPPYPLLHRNAIWRTGRRARVLAVGRGRCIPLYVTRGGVRGGGDERTWEYNLQVRKVFKQNLRLYS
jgi:hypothetical protein